MNMKLIPLSLLTDGLETVSFMTSRRSGANSLWLKHSIIKDGLLNPLVVIREGGKFVVLDGKKRLAIIRLIAKSKQLGKRIAKVPCVVQETHGLTPMQSRRPALLTGPELAHQILLSSTHSVSHVSIAQRFECDLNVVEDCLSLRKLHPEILLHFNNRTISLEQAAAFATINNMKAQLDLLHQLGPFVSDKEIIAQIRAGATVLELSEDNIIFLPSRGRPQPSGTQERLEFGKSDSNQSRYSDLIAA